jgi:hypothetical protein
MAFPVLSKSRGSRGTLERPLTARISDCSMTSSDFVMYVDATQGPVRVTLPEASNEGKMVFVQKVDGSDNVVFVKCVEGDSISPGGSLRASDRWDGWVLIADGVKTWFVASTSNGIPFSDAGLQLNSQM